MDALYNGWTNRETWAANLLVTNDEALYTVFSDFASDIRACRFDYPLTALANKLRLQFEMMQDTLLLGRLPPEIGRALLDVGALWRVNWSEIAEGFLSD